MMKLVSGSFVSDVCSSDLHVSPFVDKFLLLLVLTYRGEFTSKLLTAGCGIMHCT